MKDAKTDERIEDAAREMWIENGGARLFAVEIGSGPPIVFLHGGLADHRASLFRVGALASSFRVVAPDLRGSGRSHCHGALSWDLLADDVAAWLAHLGVERAIVGGVSAGSAVAVRFALRHPRRVSALVLMAPAFAGRDRGLEEAQRVAMELMDAHGRRAPREGIDVLRPLYERLPEPIRTRALDMMREFDPRSVAATTRFLASGEQPFDTADELSSIDVPVLIVPGTDPEHPAAVAALYAERLPRAIVVNPTNGDLARELADLSVRA